MLVRTMEIAKKTIVQEQKQPFWDYIREKFKVDKPVEFLQSLKEPEREKIFLRWKWGLNNEAANESLENTRRTLLQMMPSLDRVKDDYEFEYWRAMVVFEGKCVEYRKTIGLKTYFVPNLWTGDLPF